MASFAEQMKAAGVVVRDDMNRVFRGAIEEGGRRLIDKSPIRSGRFKSNWRYGLTTPDLFTTQATNDRVLHNLEELPKDAISFVHFATNALPYGPSLERGSSTQAPLGFARLTATEWPQIVGLSVARAA